MIEGREIWAAAIQMSSTPNKEQNLQTAERLIRASVSAGANLVALPELWSCHGLEKVYRENAEPVPGPTTEGTRCLDARGFDPRRRSLIPKTA